MLKAQDLGNYFRVKSDNRDLNYKKYFSEGQNNYIKSGYNSENTKQLDIIEMKKLLLKLPEVQKEINGQ